LFPVAIYRLKKPCITEIFIAFSVLFLEFLFDFLEFC